ncbi:ABC transporter permease [Alkalicoccus luteus]|uniref:ABC transporter permease n=1 Tax=Alkalicoccus luteus TaxID=1237094 RepID=UPI001FE7F7B2|nr:sugar ABC transporter permease [Alkalicoccus luteus]
MSSSVKSWLLALPVLLFMAVFAAQGLYRAWLESVQVDGAGLFSAYTELLTGRTFWASFGISVYVSFISAVLSVVIGLWLVRLLHRYFLRDDWKLAVWFPMLIPHFAAAYLTVLFFSPGGWFASVSASAGLDGFPILVNDPLYIGVILTYLWKEIPFVVLMLLPVYQELDWRMEEAARSLGAGAWTRFKTVELPWSGPVLLEVWLILFVFMLGAYEIPVLLGVTYPSMLPVLAFEWFYQAGWSQRPLAQAMMVVLTAISAFTAFLLLYIIQRSRRRWLRGGMRA